MRRFLLLVAIGMVVPLAAQAAPMDAWLHVQEGFAEGQIEDVDEALRALKDEATELDPRRMPSFAAASVAWAVDHPGEQGEAVLRTARELDPELPSTYFFQSRWSWRQGSWVRAAGQYLAGFRALYEFEQTRRLMFAWLVLWAVLAVAASFLVMMPIIILRHFRQLVYDGREIGARAFRPANAWVFAVVVVLLPLFAGLGPIWLFVYLFVLSWVYLDKPLRIWMGVACGVLAVSPLALEATQDFFLRSLPLAARVSTMLDERQVDFSTMREFADLESEYAGEPRYHLILGELLRMHSETEAAKVQFQKASFATRKDVRPDLFLGNLAMEEGDVRRGIQYYNAVVESDGRNALAYHNLSLAFDLNRRFQEGDAARAKAREIAGREEASLGLRGRDPRIRYPELGRGDVKSLIGRSKPELKLMTKGKRVSFGSVSELLAPMSLVFWLGGLFGLIVLTLRSRRFPPSRDCTKCGKVYRLEQGFGESSVYCSQCVSVFLKRDVVSIEQQTVKLGQIQRWERLVVLARRVTGSIVPGSLQMLGERVWLGVVIGLLASFSLVGGLVMVPLFLPQVEPFTAVRPLQILLIAFFGLIWARSALGAWVRG